MKKINRLVSLSDLHFGNRNIPASILKERLEKYFFPYLDEKVFLTMNGDILDRSLNLNNLASHTVVEFYIQLFNKLEQYNSILRILRGTYVHELNQSKISEKIYKANKYTFNFRYIDKIEYEYIKPIKLKVLYIPDDLPFKNSNFCIQYIKKHLSSFNINQVDYIFAHCSFKHAFPPNLLSYPKITFNVDQFKNLVKYYIISGHIHIPSQYKNVIYIGSFDRLKHGESGKKGFIIIDNFKDINNKITFIENRDATIYKDFFYKNEISTEVLIENITKLIKKEFIDKTIGYLRLINIPLEYKFTLQKYIKNNYPFINFKFTNSNKNNNTNIKDIKLDSINNDNNILIPNEFNLPSIIQSSLNKINYKLSIDKISKYINR